MLSMTGFGSGTVRMNSGQVTANVQTLNHRFLDIRLRIPRVATSFSGEIEKRVRQSVQRGHVEVSVLLQGGTGEPPTINWQQARPFLEELKKLRDELCPEQPMPLQLLSCLPDFVLSAGPDQTALHDATLQAIDIALEHHHQMRKEEGGGIRQHLLECWQTAERIAEEIATDTDRLVREQSDKSKERLGQIVSSFTKNVDEVRVDQEIALIASRMDIAEEIQRLSSHIQQFRETLSAAAPVGRKLDFVLQEMARESNTMATKLRQSRMNPMMLELKATIERMREQVQNVL